MRHLMAEATPTAEPAKIGGELATHQIDLAQRIGLGDAPEGRLVLVEAVAHRHGHVRAGSLDLCRNTPRRRVTVGDRLFRQDVEPGGDGEIDIGLVEGWRHHDGAEIRLGACESQHRVGEASCRIKAEDPAAFRQRFGIDVKQADDLDRAVLDVAWQEFAAPLRAEAAGTDVKHLAGHGASDAWDPAMPDRSYASTNGRGA